MLTKEQKKNYISEMTTHFENSKAVMVTHYQGLTMVQLDDLRAKMREHGIIFRITVCKVIILLYYWILTTNHYKLHEHVWSGTGLDGPKKMHWMQSLCNDEVTIQTNMQRLQTKRVFVNFLTKTKIQTHSCHHR